MNDFLKKAKDATSKLAQNIESSDVGGKMKSTLQKVQTDVVKKDIIKPNKNFSKAQIVEHLKNLQGDDLFEILQDVNVGIQQDIAIQPIIKAFSDTYQLTKVEQNSKMVIFKVKRKAKGSLFAYMFVLNNDTEEIREELKKIRSENDEMNSIEQIVINLETLTFITDVEDALVINKDLQKAKEDCNENNTVETRQIEMTHRTILKTEEPEVETEENKENDEAAETEKASE